MRQLLKLPILLSLLLAGCSSDELVHMSRDAKATASLASGSAGTPARARAVHAPIAAMPDTGALVKYDAVLKPQRHGAYTTYPVSLSEEHALNAMQGGTLVFNTPDGEVLRIEYARHEEHSDGNWTWVGRGHDDGGAILTFGQDAVFGSIPRKDGGLLRITTVHGRTYMVDVERKQLANQENPKSTAGDFLIPPRSAALEPGAYTSSAAQAQSSNNALAATNYIDVLLGYSNGLASRIGSDSGAITRMQNIVALANLAYEKSAVVMRLRLVRSMRVNYPDNTSNTDTLQKLTGSTGSGSIPVDPAFSALRATREEVGADVVSFVRQFREPENDGCGIAWLLGGEQVPIVQSDAGFAYSVVSDGTDVRESDGRTYVCRDETLAHELGHTMGQAHNIEDSSSQGAHAYSYGYREASSVGFFTIMAYRIDDSSQFSIPYFANPAVSYQGRPTGVGNQSDNVRSMNQTMPIVATFRATVIPASGGVDDFNGDGLSDILWRNYQTGSNAIWSGGNSAVRIPITGVSVVSWRIVGTGDFDADGRSDVLWRQSGSGENVIWRAANAGSRQAVATVPWGSWIVAGIGDFDGDARSDILWRNTSTGANTIWKSGNAATVQATTAVTNRNWQVVAVGDFNGDGRSDIVWRDLSTGVNTLWRSGSFATRSSLGRVSDLRWVVVGAGDLDGNGFDDLVWRHRATGANSVWPAANYNAGVNFTAVTDQRWQVERIADYNGDGRMDLFWRNATTGEGTLWFSANFATRRSISNVPGNQWQVAP